MIRTNVSFYEEQYERIKKECYDNGESLSAFLRNALDVYWKDSKFVSISPEDIKPQNKDAYKFKPTKIIEETPHIVKTNQDLDVQIKKALAKKPQNSLCPVCGSFLNQYGECNNKFRHK